MKHCYIFLAETESVVKPQMTLPTPLLISSLPHFQRILQEQLFLDRCDAGLFTLQQVDLILVRLVWMPGIGMALLNLVTTLLGPLQV